MRKRIFFLFQTYRETQYNAVPAEVVFFPANEIKPTEALLEKHPTV